MSNKIYLIHGFNVHDGGASTVGSMKGLLENKGYEVIEIRYGVFGRLRVRLCNVGVAHTITQLIEPGSTCIAHSNGAAIAYLACEYGAEFKNVTLINPALDSNLALAKQIKNIQVWYAPNDKWTGLAKYIPNSIWGAQGRKGYTGKPDKRYRQFNQEELLGRFEDEHSGIFSSTLAKIFFIDKQIDMIRGE